MFRFSTGTRNGILAGLGISGMFLRGFVQIFTGTQPADADMASTSSTLLGVLSDGGLTPSYETAATGTITLTGGASGSINTVTVGGMNIIPDGAVPFNASLNQTASDLCDAINRNGIYRASVAGAVVTISPRAGAGDSHNAYVVTATLSTITASYANMSGGVDGANGLIWQPPVTGVIDKPTRPYSFIGLASGTAGWYRHITAAGDSGLLLSGAPWLPRIDGAIGIGVGEGQMSNTVVTLGVPNTIDIIRITQPKQ